MSARLKQRRLGVVGVGLVLALAAAAMAGQAGSPVAVRVVENTTDRIVLEYSFPRATATAVEVDGRPCVTLSVPHEPSLLIAGAPELPHVTRSVIIPNEGTMQVAVVDGEYQDAAGVAVTPSKGNLLRTVDPATVPYHYGSAYGQDAFFPGTLAELHEPYILRDFRGCVVDVFPYQYNPVRGVLRSYSRLTVEVKRIGGGGVNVLTGQPRALTAAFNTIYKSHFLNYAEPARYNPLDEQGDMLIICHDPWIPNMQPFVDHKNDIGINTTIVGVSTIGNNWSSIKAYVQNVYNTSDLAFLLLVGDGAQVDTPTASGGSSDPTYSKLAGGDNYPDIMVGRFSAETAAQVDTQVLRSVEYEQNMSTTTDWFWRGMGIASNQGAGMGDEGQADNVHMNEIRQWLLAYGYTTVDQIYDPSGTAQMVTNGLNNGRGIINYCGHGSTTSWGTTGFSNSHVQALQNDNMLPFIISVACVNGQFDGYTCFAEAWLRSTHAGEPIGAIGTYMSSINQSWAPPMEAEDEFNILLTQIEPNAYWSYGALCFAGSCSMMDAYGGGPSGGGTQMFDTWHVFGDPSLRIVGVTTPPHGIGVTPEETLDAIGPWGGPFAPSSAVYTVKNRGDFPLDYAVTAPVSWLDITNGSGTLAPDAEVAVTVSINSQANSMGTGHYSAAVAFLNLTNGDGDTLREVTLTIGIPEAFQTWNFDVNPGWTTEGAWAFGQPTGGGSHARDPNSGFTGTNVYGYNLAGDYTNSMPVRNLTTTAIDCTGISGVTLKFMRRLGVEASDDASVRVSADGTNWTTVWDNNGVGFNEAGWTAVSYDISAVADNQPTVYIRWTMGPTDVSVTYPGWNIDDVELWGTVAHGPGGTPGDMDCDGEVGFSDINPFVLAMTNPEGYALQYPNCNRMNGDINDNGTFGFDDINPFVALLTGP